MPWAPPRGASQEADEAGCSASSDVTALTEVLASVLVRMRGPIAGLCGALVTACLPAPHPLAGRACDDAHPCGEGYVCLSNICEDSPDAGPLVPGVNLFPAGSFETLESWSDEPSGAQFRLQTMTVRSGQWAGALSRGDPGPAAMVSDDSDLDLAGPGTYCVLAFVRGATNEPVEVELLLQGMAGVEASARVSGSRIPPPGADWALVATRAELAARHLGLRVRISTTVSGRPEGALYADDVVVWRSSRGGRCD